MRVKAARKWIEEQSSTSRAKASITTGGIRKKKRKIGQRKTIVIDSSDSESGSIVIDYSHSESESDLSLPIVSRPKHDAKSAGVINMSTIHGPSNNSDPGGDARDGMSDNGGVEGATMFPYEPLTLDGQDIRIILLQPGEGDMGVECKLKKVVTNGKPRVRYRALSYTWGPEAPTMVLCLDGIEIQVRENLWLALWHIREKEGEVALWVDAICINQEDIPERNHQVSRMGTLYGQAEEVIVWLGPESDYSTSAFSFIRQTVSPPFRGLGLDLSSTEFSAWCSTELKGMLALLDRTYWTRVWIIQEVFRARKILIRCGHETLPWKDLARFFRLLRNLPRDEMKLIAGHPVYEMITALGHNPAATLTEHRTTRFQDLETLLLAYHESRCCDPRDKVYSLLGLARNRLTPRTDRVEGTEWLSIDYSRSPRDLFRILTLMYLSQVGDPYSVRWMQLLQKILCLPAPWTVDKGMPLPANTLNHVTLSSLRPFKISQVGPEVFYDQMTLVRSERMGGQPIANPFGNILDWYKKFTGGRMPTATRLTGILQNISKDDIERLECFKRVHWDAEYPDKNRCYTFSDTLDTSRTCIRPFTTYNGRVGITTCDITSNDDLLRFHGTDIAFVVEMSQLVTRAEKISIKGRAFIIPSDNTTRTSDFIASYNAFFKYAVPSKLDEDGHLPIRRDMLKCVKECEVYRDLRKRTDDPYYSLSLTLEEWEIWTW